MEAHAVRYEINLCTEYLRTKSSKSLYKYINFLTEFFLYFYITYFMLQHYKKSDRKKGPLKFLLDLPLYDSCIDMPKHRPKHVAYM
jgi:hypothetical protein